MSPTNNNSNFQQDILAYQEQVKELNTLVEKLQTKTIKIEHQNDILEDEISTLLAQNQNSLDQSFNSVPAIIIAIDSHGKILEANDNACHFFNLDKKQLTQRSLRSFLSHSSFSEFTFLFNQFKESNTETFFFHSLSLKNQEQFSFTLKKELALGHNKFIRFTQFVGLIKEYSLNNIEYTNYLANMAIEQLREGIIITESDGTILRVNNAFSEISGFSANEVIGKTPRVLKSGRHNKDFYNGIWEHINHHGWWSGEIWNKRKNGQIYPEWLQINRLVEPSSKKIYYVSIFTDITERKTYQNKLDRLAHFDSLTGLINRHFLQISLEGLLDRTSQEKQSKLAVIFMDLDLFKQINDNFGHHEGDLVLQETAQRILASVRSTDIVSRIGGDEFVIALTRFHQISTIKEITNKLLQQIANPYFINGNKHFISASMGISIYPDDADNVEDLMKRADASMYRSKAEGRNKVIFFEKQHEHHLISKAFIKKLILSAIEKPEKYIEMHYQPVINCLDNTLVSFEALIRLRNDEGEMFSPDKFIEIAEKENLIKELGLALFKVVCCFVKENKKLNLKNYPIAVNLSAKQFAHNELFDDFEKITTSYGLNINQFSIEITESSAMENMDCILKLLHRFRHAGCKVYLDDFGTGYASLSQLHSLPIDVVKIDRSFINSIESSNDSHRKLIIAILSMAAALNLDVVTEGVETESQCQWLKVQGVVKIQGYLYSKPLDEKDIRQRYLA